MTTSPTTDTADRTTAHGATDDAATDTAATVAVLYAAFGRGDVPAILERLAPDVAWDDWADNFAQRAGVPHLLPRHGRDEVAGFFAVLAPMTLLDFAVLDLIGTGRQVVAEVRASFALPNGGRFADEELHLWTFDEAGRVSRFRHYCDTAKHIAATGGADTLAG
jgi:ketosteroid isomerase-like protein